MRNDLRADNLEQLSEGAYDYKLGAFYLDTINGFEKLADYILNVAQTKARQTRV